MSLLLDIKYLNLLSPTLERFQKKSEYLWNFRCPVCLDSQKSKTKARGYVYRTKGDLYYKCHNCSISLSFGNFLKMLNENLYGEYSLERYVTGETGRKAHKTPKLIIPQVKQAQVNFERCLDLPRITDLPDHHIAVKYVKTRLIPQKYHRFLYFADDFQGWTNDFTDGNYNDKYKVQGSDIRLVIPFLNGDNEVTYIQARSLIPSNIRYVTIKVNQNYPKIYGLDRWNPNKVGFCVEGPIDSLFLPNAIATADADLASTIDKIDGCEKLIFIHDNEPRNEEICRQMKKTIESGLRIVIWPENLQEKDINDIARSGRKVLDIIAQRVYHGLEAFIEFNHWKKCK